MKRILALLVTAVAASVTLAVPAAAQYPAPQEPITISVSNPNPGVGETVTINIVISGNQARAIDGDASGPLFVSARKPSPAMLQALAFQQSAPYTCTSAVSGGSGATVNPTNFTTDDEGRASLSLFTGTQPGLLTVSVQCGSLSSQVVIPVGGAATPPAPPATGFGPGPSEGSSIPGFAWLLIPAAIGVAGVTWASYARRRKGSES